MKRRAFLRVLGLAPIVGPAAVKAALTAAPEPLIAEAAPFVFTGFASDYAAVIPLVRARMDDAARSLSEHYFATFTP